jgi:hypothetical protein
LPLVVQSDEFIPKAGKIFFEKFAINIMEKNNAWGKGQAGIPEIKDTIVSMDQQKKLEIYHLPINMGDNFFIPDYFQIFVRGNIFYVSGNDYGNFVFLNKFIQPPGNFIGIPFNSGSFTAKKITVDENFDHLGNTAGK